MEPRIINKGAMLIAGLTGMGNETGTVWAAFAELARSSPLSNKVTEDKYEVRTYWGTGPGEVHVGNSVGGSSIPSGYALVSLAPSLYAEFEIPPAQGYMSRNPEMDRWLAENGAKYGQGRLGDKHFSVLVYDSRYKGEKNRESVVACWVPLIKRQGE